MYIVHHVMCGGTSQVNTDAIDVVYCLYCDLATPTHQHKTLMIKKKHPPLLVYLLTAKDTGRMYDRNVVYRGSIRKKYTESCHRVNYLALQLRYQRRHQLFCSQQDEEDIK